MPNFYSRSGNIEVWDEKPKGYFSQDEWDALSEDEKPDEYKATLPPKPSLDALKTLKIAEIESVFKASKANRPGGLEVEGIGVINAGDGHLANCQSMIKLLEAKGGDMDFRLYDNSLKKLNLEQFKQMELALITFGASMYAKKWGLEAQVSSATSSDELENIKVEF